MLLFRYMASDQKQKSFKLPASFLLGAASSSHQVEGNNTNCDWWLEEQAGKLPKSGVATDFYHRYAEDFGLAKQVGLNAMRVSIEWSRIEPQPGHWDTEAVEHYRKVLQEMKNQGLSRLVTLHHFTLPVWLYKKGGFGSSDSVTAFTRYARYIAEQLGTEIDLWNTINEPEIYTSMTSQWGTWPPFSKSPIRAFMVFNNLAKAHIQGYLAIKSVLPSAQISIAKNNIHFEAFKPNSWLDQTAVQLSKYFRNFWFLNKIKDHLDFIGLNYYFYRAITVSIEGITEKNKHVPKSDMGWQTFPEGIYHLIMDLTHRYGKPIYITENGIANARDDMRKDFIREHLYWVSKANSQGADVRGYFYWSLTDTYEWQDGYDPKFGLVEIDFERDQTRKVRPSAEIFQEIKNNQN